MAAKLEIVPANKNMIEKAKILLMEAMNEEFDHVILFGLKQGTLTTMVSQYRNHLEVVGALEEAKMAISRLRCNS